MAFLRRTSLRRGLGPLSMLAVLLLVSGALRFLGGPGAALAKEVGDLRAAGAPLSGPDNCTPEADVAALLEALAAREARVGEREEYFARRSAALAKAETEIARQLAALQEAEDRLAATLSEAASASENDVARLTAVYENMKPKEAAQLFETMSPAFAAGFLGRMRPEAAAKVVEGLSPESAYSISVILAGRNAEVPRN